MAGPKLSLAHEPCRFFSARFRGERATQEKKRAKNLRSFEFIVGEPLSWAQSRRGKESINNQNRNILLLAMPHLNMKQIMHSAISAVILSFPAAITCTRFPYLFCVENCSSQPPSAESGESFSEKNDEQNLLLHWYQMNAAEEIMSKISTYCGRSFPRKR